MENLIEALKQQLGNDGLQQLSQKVGAQPDQVSKALEGIVPTLLGAMTQNTKSGNGAQGLLAALDRDHDGSILDDIQGFLGTSSPQGAGILKHVLGDKRLPAEQSIQGKTGLNAQATSQLFETIAPLIMGMLGKEKRQSSGGFDAGTIAQVLGSLTGKADKSTGLDLSDILSMFMGESSTGNSRGRKTTKQSAAAGGLASLAGGLLRSLLKKR